MQTPYLIKNFLVVIVLFIANESFSQVFVNTFVTGLNIASSTNNSAQITGGSNVTVYDSGASQVSPDLFSSPTPTCVDGGVSAPCTTTGTTVLPIIFTVIGGTGADGELVTGGIHNISSHKNYAKITPSSNTTLNFTGNIIIRVDGDFITNSDNVVNIDGNVIFHVDGKFGLGSNSMMNFTPNSTLKVLAKEVVINNDVKLNPPAPQDLLILSKGVISTSSSLMMYGYFYSDTEINISSGCIICGAIAAKKKISMSSGIGILSGLYLPGQNPVADILMANLGRTSIDCLTGTPIILSVELISLDATVTDNNQVVINWKTASEKNNNHFEIQRSQNAVEWETIEIIEGAGNSTEIREYETVDKNGFSGISYYRLKQVDIDGNYTHSAMKSVRISGNHVRVYPSLASDFVYIEGSPEELESITLYTAFGQDISDQVTIDKLSSTEVRLTLSETSAAVIFVKTKTVATRIFILK